jgi:uncharacterized protein
VKQAKHVPIRTCLGCGARAPQAVLLRISCAADGALALVQRAHTGRSGYLHAQVECWRRFAARKGPVRSLGCCVDKPRRLAFVAGLEQAERSAPMR